MGLTPFKIEKKKISTCATKKPIAKQSYYKRIIDVCQPQKIQFTKLSARSYFLADISTVSTYFLYQSTYHIWSIQKYISFLTRKEFYTVLSIHAP